jgi:hypothetical protein
VTPGVVRLSSKDLQLIEIDGVKYVPEIFRVFAAPDPNRYYQFSRDGETVTVREYRVDERIRELERTIASHEAALDLASALLAGGKPQS